MRTFLKALLVVGIGAMLLQGASNASAANLDVKRHAVRHHHHYRSAVVRDYDGSLVVRRIRRVVVQNYDGTSMVTLRSDLYPVDRGAGRHYLNGQPVLPHQPRGWPRVRLYGSRYI
jgi:hypothetical protein